MSIAHRAWFGWRHWRSSAAPAPAGSPWTAAIVPCAGASLRALPVRVERGYLVLDDGVPLEEPADLAR